MANHSSKAGVTRALADPVSAQKCQSDVEATSPNAKVGSKAYYYPVKPRNIPFREADRAPKTLGAQNGRWGTA